MKLILLLVAVLVGCAVADTKQACLKRCNSQKGHAKDVCVTKCNKSSFIASRKLVPAWKLVVERLKAMKKAKEEEKHLKELEKKLAGKKGKLTAEERKALQEERRIVELNKAEMLLESEKHRIELEARRKEAMLDKKIHTLENEKELEEKRLLETEEEMREEEEKAHKEIKKATPKKSDGKKKAAATKKPVPHPVLPNKYYCLRDCLRTVHNIRSCLVRCNKEAAKGIVHKPLKVVYHPTLHEREVHKVKSKEARKRIFSTKVVAKHDKVNKALHKAVLKNVMRRTSETPAERRKRLAEKQKKLMEERMKKQRAMFAKWREYRRQRMKKWLHPIKPHHVVDHLHPAAKKDAKKVVAKKAPVQSRKLEHKNFHLATQHKQLWNLLKKRQHAVHVAPVKKAAPAKHEEAKHDAKKDAKKH